MTTLAFPEQFDHIFVANSSGHTYEWLCIDPDSQIVVKLYVYLSDMVERDEPGDNLDLCSNGSKVSFKLF